MNPSGKEKKPSINIRGGKKISVGIQLVIGLTASFKYRTSSFGWQFKHCPAGKFTCVSILAPPVSLSLGSAVLRPCHLLMGLKQDSPTADGHKATAKGKNGLLSCYQIPSQKKDIKHMFAQCLYIRSLRSCYFYIAVKECGARAIKQ